MLSNLKNKIEVKSDIKFNLNEKRKQEAQFRWMRIKTTKTKQMGKGVLGKMSLVHEADGLGQDYCAGLLTEPPKAISAPPHVTHFVSK